MHGIQTVIIKYPQDPGVETKVSSFMRDDPGPLFSFKSKLIFFSLLKMSFFSDIF